MNFSNNKGQEPLTLQERQKWIDLARRDDPSNPFSKFPKNVRDDELVASNAVEINEFNFDFVSGRLRNDRNFLEKIILENYDKKHKTFERNGILSSAGKDIQDDADFMLRIIAKTTSVFSYVSDRLKGDKNFIIKAIQLSEPNSISIGAIFLNIKDDQVIKSSDLDVIEAIYRKSTTVYMYIAHVSGNFKSEKVKEFESNIKHSINKDYEFYQSEVKTIAKEFKNELDGLNRDPEDGWQTEDEPLTKFPMEAKLALRYNLEFLNTKDIQKEKDLIQDPREGFNSVREIFDEVIARRELLNIYQHKNKIGLHNKKARKILGI